MDSRRRDLMLAGVLFLVATLLHLRTTGFGFIWDDDANVTANALLSGPDQLARIWTGKDIYQFYPLTFTSYWLQDRILGLSPAACHAVNVILHGLVVVLLYAVLRRLRTPGAFFGALLFAVHPMATETVAWVTERKNLLAAALALGATWAYLGSGRRAHPGSLGLFVLAVLAKTHVVVLPAFLFLLDVWRRRRSPFRSLLGLLPFALVSVAASILTVVFETRHVVRDGADWEWAATFPERVVTAGKVITFYFVHAFWPAGLAFVYDPWTIDATRPAAWVPTLTWAVGCVVLLVLAKTRGGAFRSLAFVVLSFVVWLGPVLGFFRVYFMRYAYVQDHFAYFALLVLVPGSVGMLAAALGSATHQAVSPVLSGGTSPRPGREASQGAGPDSGPVGTVEPTRRVGPAQTVLAAAALIAAAAFSVVTWRHQADFRDLETLWMRTTEKSPRAWMAWTNLGVHRSGQGRDAEAVELHRRAIAIDARRAEPHLNLGYALEVTGDIDGAIAEYRRAAELEPEDPVPLYNLGNSLVRAGRPREAMQAYESALDKNREYPHALNGMGVALAETGRPQVAAQYWAEAIVVDPTFRDSYRNLARALEQVLTPSEAVALLQRASTATEGGNPAVETLLARTWLRIGNDQEATLAIDRAETAARSLGIHDLDRDIEETRLSIAN
ncbi:MAG: tetratricopeptide repeat protein [Candidatus Eisenbacteria bacterium]